MQDHAQVKEHARVSTQLASITDMLARASYIVVILGVWYF